MSKTEITLSQFRAVVFDMDGTMVDNMGYHERAWRQFLKQHQIEVTEEQFAQSVGRHNSAIFELFLQKKLDPAEAQRLGDEKEALYRELYGPHVRALPGLREVVGEAGRRGLKLAIATTASPENRHLVLEKLVLGPEFEVIMGGEHIAHGKPDPEIYLKTAAALKVDPADCLAFEDTRPGVAAAKAAGMTVVGVMTTHSAAELAEADYQIKDYTQLSFT